MTTLAHLLENSARAFPDRGAAVHDGESLNYAELAQLSDRLAHQLRQFDVGKGSRVGLWLPKSCAAIVAIFGVLKSGAAYVPSPDSSPPKRVQHIATDCGMKVLLTDDAGAQQLAALNLGKTLVMVLDMGALVKADDQQFMLTAEADDLAYILYTSGSTGAPKGVMITHRASLNFVDWATEQFGIVSSDKLVSLAPLSFDLSIFDIFASAKAGACVHLISPERAIMPAALSKYVAENTITIWYSVPTALARLPQYGGLDKHSLISLRHIIFAGEPFPPQPLKDLMEAVPSARFHNLYGPTETNVVSHFEVEDSDGSEIPLGWPCAGHKFTIVDEEGAVLTGDAIGELLVEGPSLMSGYCNHPNTGIASGKRYHTGDKVRRDSDGLYHFIGRLDDMIKTRGFRVEPGEIESVLSRCPSVREVAVLGQPDPNIGNRLVALVVSTQPIADLELAARCAQFLPKYMIPSEFVQIRDNLPRTRNGKIDRAVALRLVDDSRV